MLGFEPVPPSTADAVLFSPGHVGNVLIAWGDPIFAGVAPKDPRTLTPGDQEQRFGYNNDYVAFIPLPSQDAERRGLLWANHEYTDAQNMFPGFDPDAPSLTRDQVLVEMHAHGGSVIEIERVGAGWRPVVGSRYNRRVTANSPMVLTGPAAGDPPAAHERRPERHARLRHPQQLRGWPHPVGHGPLVRGELQRVLRQPLGGHRPRLTASHERYGLSDEGAGYQWSKHIHRFDLGIEPTSRTATAGSSRSTRSIPVRRPKKRTALGRFKHEGATVAISRAGRVCVYTGDDERFDYAYKFVSDGTFDPAQPCARPRHPRQRHAHVRQVRRRRHRHVAPPHRRGPAPRRGLRVPGGGPHPCP
jgi:secreted PhoX family phosphatase